LQEDGVGGDEVFSSRGLEGLDARLRGLLASCQTLACEEEGPVGALAIAGSRPSAEGVDSAVITEEDSASLDGVEAGVEAASAVKSSRAVLKCEVDALELFREVPKTQWATHYRKLGLIYHPDKRPNEEINEPP